MKKLLVALTLFSALAPTAEALWIAIPLEILVDEADLIVAGEVTDIKPGFPPYDNAVIKVSRVMKALPGSGQPKTVLIAQPGQGGLRLSTDIRFRVGQEGVWLLTKDPDRQVYWAKHPSQFQHNLGQVADLVKARAKLPEGKAVNGLVARAEVAEQRAAKGPPSYEVRFSLKNVSEKPIAICNFPGHLPFKADWTGPEGTKLKSDHYQWLATAKIGLTKDSFVTIPPGGVRFVGPHGRFSGIWFQAKTAPVGQHQVTISFGNSEDGQRFQVGNVWTGTITANTVSFALKK